MGYHACTVFSMFEYISDRPRFPVTIKNFNNVLQLL